MVAGEAEEEIQRALYVGNTSAAVDAALQVRACRTALRSDCYWTTLPCSRHLP